MKFAVPSANRGPLVPSLCVTVCLNQRICTSYAPNLEQKPNGQHQQILMQINRVLQIATWTYITPNHIRCSIVPGKACQNPVIPLCRYIFFAKPIGEVYVGIFEVANKGDVDVLWNCI